jgi:hypothetical protein
MRSSFTVLSHETDTCEILFIEKSDLMRMKFEHMEEFNEFLTGATQNVSKLIQVKLCAMDVCHAQYKKWQSGLGIGVPKYEFKVFSNNEVASMTEDALTEKLQEAREKLN